jgi:hypothetical protein
MSRLASAGVGELLGCRDLVGNRLEGPVPPLSLLVMRTADILYAPPPVFALEPPMPSHARLWLQPLPARGLPARAVRT